MALTGNVERVPSKRMALVIKVGRVDFTFNLERADLDSLPDFGRRFWGHSIKSAADDRLSGTEQQHGTLRHCSLSLFGKPVLLLTRCPAFIMSHAGHAVR